MPHPRTSRDHFTAGGTARHVTVDELLEQLHRPERDGHHLVLADAPAHVAQAISATLAPSSVLVEGHGLWLAGLATAIHNAIASFVDAPERAMQTATAFDEQRALPREMTTLEFRVDGLARETFAAARALCDQLPQDDTATHPTVVLHSLDPLAAERLVGWRDALWQLERVRLVMVAPPADRDRYLWGSGDSWCSAGGIWQVR